MADRHTHHEKLIIIKPPPKVVTKVVTKEVPVYRTVYTSPPASRPSTATDAEGCIGPLIGLIATVALGLFLGIGTYQDQLPKDKGVGTFLGLLIGGFIMAAFIVGAVANMILIFGAPSAKK
jgi:hypothetical protein